MTQVVLQLSRSRISATRAVEASSPVAGSREMVLLGLVLGALQILDGYLTAIGVYRYGTSIEGNPFLRFLMDSYGFIPTLFVTKIAAIGIIGVLCSLCVRVAWLPTAMRAMIAIYLTFAIIPWCVILAHRLA